MCNAPTAHLSCSLQQAVGMSIEGLAATAAGALPQAEPAQLPFQHSLCSRDCSASSDHNPWRNVLRLKDSSPFCEAVCTWVCSKMLSAIWLQTKAVASSGTQICRRQPVYKVDRWHKGWHKQQIDGRQLDFWTSFGLTLDSVNQVHDVACSLHECTALYAQSKDLMLQPDWRHGR